MVFWLYEGRVEKLNSLVWNIFLENSDMAKTKISVYFKVPIIPQFFLGPVESVCHAEQNGKNFFAFGQNWNFL